MCTSKSDKSEEDTWKTGSSKLVTILNPFDKKMKDLRTLKQHYYPEGGWGWVIVLVTLCVQLISHGLQFALAMYVMAVPKSSVISRRLLNASFDQSGKEFLNYKKGCLGKMPSNGFQLNYSYLKKSLNATKQALHKHVSRKMLSAAVHNGLFLSTDILAPSSQEVYLTFIEKGVFCILKG